MGTMFTTTSAVSTNRATCPVLAFLIVNHLIAETKLGTISDVDGALHAALAICHDGDGTFAGILVVGTGTVDGR
jgi:hypothetical protein